MDRQERKRIQLAKKCQIISGSFDGRKNACLCEVGNDCAFTRKERDELRNHPDIEKHIEKVREEYEQLKEEKAKL